MEEKTFIKPSALQIKELRKKTSAGIADCKKALVNSEGDIQKAVIWLRENGIAAAAKRADKDATEGAISLAISSDKKQISLVELNCETDFVARGEDFVKVGEMLTETCLKRKVASVDALMKETINGHQVSDIIIDLSAKVGEKLVVNRVLYKQADQGILSYYLHFGSKLAAIVGMEGVRAQEVIKNVAMQVAASSPLAIDRDGISKEDVERELEVFKNQALKDKKPVAIVDKIASGRLAKYYQEVVLLEQTFIKDNTKSIKSLLVDFGDDIKINSFERVQIGET